MSNEEALFTWYGRPNTELSREELLEVIEFFIKEKLGTYERPACNHLIGARL